MDALDFAPAAARGSSEDILVLLESAQAPHGVGTHPSSDDAVGSRLFMRVLDELDYGLMLVSDQAKLRFANRVAMRECAPARCMRLQNGHVLPRYEREQQGFYRALAASRLGRRSMLSLRSDDAQVCLAVVPVHESAAGGGLPATLLVFGRRQVCEPLTVDFFAREQHLTAAETVVLRALCEGARPADIARQCGLAVSTVRTQITSLRLKTGARSIGELVRMVTVLPPIVPVLD